MKASGNGASGQCVKNLLRITRGEVPYDRIKGLDASVIDAPVAQIAPLVEADAVWMVCIYEPRVQVVGATLSDMQARNGQFIIDVQTIPKGGTTT